MKHPLKPQRTLIWCTLALFAALIMAPSILHSEKLPDAIDIRTFGQPTVGNPNAKVHVIAFEEPKCSNCADYSKIIYPELKKNYIDTNKIAYSVITVSFLPQSMPAACALLAVYHQNPHTQGPVFFAYLEKLYKFQPSNEAINWATKETLLKLAAETSPNINLEKLGYCIDHNTWTNEVQNNTNYGRAVMEGHLSTPTLYVNGVEVKNLTYEELSHLIDNYLVNP